MHARTVAQEVNQQDDEKTPGAGEVFLPSLIPVSPTSELITEHVNEFPLIKLSTLVVILIESFAILLSIPLCVDHAFQ